MIDDDPDVGNVGLGQVRSFLKFDWQNGCTCSYKYHCFAGSKPLGIMTGGRKF